MPQNYYEALNVTAGATREQIHCAYRELARKYHPDRNNDAGAARIMAVINEAYAVLSEPARRSAYDERLQAPLGSLDDTILLAARDMLSARGWTIAEDNPHSFVLQSGAREVFVALVPTLNAATLARSSPRGGGINVILTLRVDEGAVNRGARWLIIDVIRSRVVSGVFPDATYADLFRPLY